MYAAIFGVAVGSLALVLIRQANIVNFNALVATLEERDLVNERLPQVLQHLRKEHGQYLGLMQQPPASFPPVAQAVFSGC
jgi:hypothetical protein